MGRFYWLKLKRDFFKRHDIRIIESMPNGKDYILFYLKLLCESVDHNGSLRFNDEIPYNEDMLSTITNTNVDIVRSAIKIFSQLGMMDVWDDGTYYMNEVQKMIGSCSDTDGANRMRECRERKKNALVTKCDGSVTASVTKCDSSVTPSVTEGDESKSKNKDIDKEKDIAPTETIFELYNDICKSLPKADVLSETRRKAIRARWKETPDIEKFRRVFENLEKSDFCKGNNDRGWKANIDFALSTKFPKILEGFYNKAEEPKKESFNAASFFAAAVNRK